MIEVVFGGVFNPPTIAHYKACQILQQSFEVSRFIYVPVGRQYIHKDVMDVDHRYAMVKLMADELGVEVSRIELDDPVFSGSYQTIKKLGLTNPKFLIGSDNLASFPRWIDAEKLLREYGIIVIRRQQDIKSIIDASPLLNQYRDQITIINEFDILVSSSLVRERKDSSLVIPAVAQYIKKHHLYEEEHA
jgi:nicotinate-nucleotide adenylyltransferase